MTGTGVIADSGGTVQIPNDDPGMSFLATEQLFVGTAPSTCSITVAGVMRGGTADTAADTNTQVAASVRAVAFAKVYDYFKVTASWTGGDATTKFHINWRTGYKSPS